MHRDLKHFATPGFWVCYRALPEEAQRLADEKFALLKVDPGHRSLHLKRIGPVWSVRAGLHYRALGRPVTDGIDWFWIGHHAEYDHRIG